MIIGVKEIIEIVNLTSRGRTLFYGIVFLFALEIIGDTIVYVVRTIASIFNKKGK